MEKHWEAESALGRPADGERGGHRFGPSSLSAYHSCAVITAEASPPPRSPHSLKTTVTTRCCYSNTSTASAVSALARIDCTNTDTEVGAVTRRLLFALCLPGFAFSHVPFGNAFPPSYLPPPPPSFDESRYAPLMA